MINISARIPKEIFDLVTKYKKQTGISKNWIITKALEEYLKDKVKND